MRDFSGDFGGMGRLQETKEHEQAPEVEQNGSSWGINGSPIQCAAYTSKLPQDPIEAVSLSDLPDISGTSPFGETFPTRLVAFSR
ncbi:hypothetical protein BO83DRAFT_412083 [Aspergillus eucalypticola CBS 122712]|uniref:Uncharacterized protein n=1 Tax=Aspergillus eucalypticola (strain CBS 122712 / IBT 29274) TaxID=1448314 RepID=A0A317URY0_ASPEC|nr:uncharacterized protein BO83DRAFT_412083 [Aspergillus eucalypticola CBS 122712]PWY63202.1 hypothetical protein BO83DRAFT_412083 [Aspergillus eucalypticola CBS 122712]